MVHIREAEEIDRNSVALCIAEGFRTVADERFFCYIQNVSTQF